MDSISKLFNGLAKTKESFGSKFLSLFKKSELDDDFFEELEDIFISSDMGVEISLEIIKQLKYYCKKNTIKSTEKAKEVLNDVLQQMLEENQNFKLNTPLIILVVGVNGVGKTTSIGKLANYYKDKGKSVLIVSADTFRAAANEQLSIWANRTKTRIIQSVQGSDSASVVFDGITSAKAHKEDVIIIDTAGRLQNKVNLMEELKKINRIIEREKGDYNYAKAIVLDATSGQNAVSQVNYFDEAIDIDFAILTKLDGTAKGGVIIPIIAEKHLPICFVGVGEKIDDLIVFDAKKYCEQIFK